MKHLLFLLAMLMTFAVTAQENVLVKTIDPQETHTSYALTDDEVIIKEWDRDIIRVFTTITTETGDENITKRLVTIGRYQIKTRTDQYGDYLVIEMPQRNNTILVNGEIIKDEVTIELYVPYGYEVRIKPVPDANMIQ